MQEIYSPDSLGLLPNIPLPFAIIRPCCEAKSHTVFDCMENFITYFPLAVVVPLHDPNNSFQNTTGRLKLKKQI